MTDLKVEQCDRDIWFQVLTAATSDAALIEATRRNIDSGEFDTYPSLVAIALSRQAAEKAQQERDAAKCLEISALIGAGHRSSIHSALREAATAIRSQGHE